MYNIGKISSVKKTKSGAKSGAEVKINGIFLLIMTKVKKSNLLNISHS